MATSLEKQQKESEEAFAKLPGEIAKLEKLVGTLHDKSNEHKELSTLLSDLKKIQSSQTPAQDAKLWINSRKTPQQALQGVVTAYTKAFGENIIVAKPIKTEDIESIPFGHQILMEKDSRQ